MFVVATRTLRPRQTKSGAFVLGTNDDVSVQTDIDVEPEKKSSLLIAEHIV